MNLCFLVAVSGEDELSTSRNQTKSDPTKVFSRAISFCKAELFDFSTAAQMRFGIRFLTFCLSVALPGKGVAADALPKSSTAKLESTSEVAPESKATSSNAVSLTVAPNERRLDVNKLYPNQVAIGEGILSVFGFRIYQARFFYDKEAATKVSSVDQLFDHPFLLQLHYKRGISGSRIADTSVDEMLRLGVNKEREKSAREIFAKLFPNVEAGDEIIGAYLPKEGARFYHRGESIGEIKDIEFSQNFFRIWLDPRTRDKGLRKKLLRGLGL